MYAIEGQEQVQVSEANTLLQPGARCGGGGEEEAVGGGGGGGEERGGEGDLRLELPAPMSS